ncbi:unnamed protein product [Ambrosiozyma monospora]|uniref:Unnamed protein product n=1 Tax=Ambrosiozyma monospora TaxID=43982 RepID=A0A9W6TA60_AMBMO|nr:unnamed protein product [Ambrosiozyma monospora]
MDEGNPIQWNKSPLVKSVKNKQGEDAIFKLDWIGIEWNCTRLFEIQITIIINGKYHFNNLELIRKLFRRLENWS